MSRNLLLALLAVSAMSGSAVLAQPPSESESQAESEAWGNQTTFTATQLVRWVWENNSGIAERAAAVDVATHRIGPAGSLDDPDFNYSFAPRTFGRPGQGLNQKIEFAQKLPWPGTLKARRAAATHRATAARQDEQTLRLELAAAATSGFAELYFVHRALAIHHDTHALVRDLIAGAQVRYAAGKTSQSDVLQAELERAHLDHHLLALNRMEASARAHVNGLLNRDPGLPLPTANVIPAVLGVPPLADLEKLALAAHPELKRLDAEIAAHESEVTLAEKAFYPDLRFIAGYNSLWDEADKRPILGMSVSVPLNRSKRRQALLGARAGVRQIESRRTNQAAQLLAELAQARAMLVESIDSVTLHEQSLVPLAGEFLAVALADYESGKGGFLTVVTAEKQKLTTEEDLERNRSDALSRLADLELLAGARVAVVREQAQGMAQ
jgi:cobalt-zinc-cadmium efflux system outer membrane protein